MKIELTQEEAEVLENLLNQEIAENLDFCKDISGEEQTAWLETTYILQLIRNKINAKSFASNCKRIVIQELKKECENELSRISINN